MSDIMVRLCRIGASGLEKNVRTTGMVTNVLGNIIDYDDVSQAFPLVFT